MMLDLTRTKRRRSRDREGTSVVELALTLPFLLTLFVGAVDFARVYQRGQIVIEAARAGALFAANPDLADRSEHDTVEQVVLVAAADLSPPPSVVVQYGKDSLDREYAQVTVTHQFQLVTRYLGNWSTITLTRTARVKFNSVVKSET